MFLLETLQRNWLELPYWLGDLLNKFLVRKNLPVKEKFEFAFFIKSRGE
jgi:hypothetical protein